MRFWLRTSYMATGLYLTTAALFFYANPWLDVNMSIETTRQQVFRHLLGYSYAFLSFILMLLWIKAYTSEANELKNNGKQ